MLRRTTLVLLALAAVVAFVAPAVTSAPGSTDVAFEETANAARIRAPGVHRPVLPPAPLVTPAGITLLGCAVVLSGGFLVALLRRRRDDVGDDWRARLEGAPPASR